MLDFLLSCHPAAMARRTRWIIGILAVAALIWGWFDVRVRGQLDPKNPQAHKTDFTCYTEAGAAFFDGRDPYQVTNVRGWGYPYPPLFAMLVAPLAQFDTQTQVVVWYAISLLAVWGCYREGRRLWAFALAHVVHADNPLNHSRADPLGTPSALRLWLPWIAAFTVALPVLNCLQRGQVGIAKAYLLLLGLRIFLNSKSWRDAILSGVVLALPIVLKVTPILPVGVLLFGLFVRTVASPDGERNVSRMVGTMSGLAIGLLLFVIAIPGALVGWEANQRHLTTWYREVATRANDHASADRTGGTRTVRNQSLSNALYRCGNWLMYELNAGPDDRLADDSQHYVRGSLVMDSPIADRVIVGLRWGLIVLTLISMGVVARQRDELGLATAFGLAVAATLIVAPIGRGHYYMLLMPAIFLAPLGFESRGCRRFAWFTAAVPLALCIAHYAAIGVTGRMGLLGIGTTLWFIAVSCRLIAGSIPMRTSIALQQNGLNIYRGPEKTAA